MLALTISDTRLRTRVGWVLTHLAMVSVRSFCGALAATNERMYEAVIRRVDWLIWRKSL
ncbi:hypothetical protein D3C72_2379660 [compost metagenome]